MRFRKPLFLSALVVFTACAPGDNPTEPQVDAQLAAVPDRGKSQEKACKPTDLQAVQQGKIQRSDCIFGEGQFEEIYRVDQLALGLPDLSGANMLTFTPQAEFAGIYGVSNWDATTFGVPVYGYQTFTANNTNRTFSLIGSSPEYKLFFSGADWSQIGNYTLTTSVAPSANTCETGSRTFLQGDVAFSSTINDTNACDGVITVGPNADPNNPQPLKYQFWYAKLTAGQEVTVSIDGVDPSDPTITLAAIVFGSPFALLDFSAGAGDTDRSLTFTAPFEAYYYIEVSGLPGVDSPYNLTFTSN